MTPASETISKTVNSSLRDAIRRMSLAMLAVALVAGCASGNQKAVESATHSVPAPETLAPTTTDLAVQLCALSGNADSTSPEVQAFFAGESSRVDDIATRASGLCPEFAQAALYAHQVAVYAKGVEAAQQLEHDRQVKAYTDAVAAAEAQQQEHDRQVQAYAVAVAQQQELARQAKANIAAVAAAKAQAQAQARAATQSTQAAISGNGATAICNDGTYSYSQHRSGTCSHHGGVSVWL